MQAGVVRFGYQHFVILGPGSQSAAEATECAAEQGAFWAYHDQLYDRGGALGNESLKQFAADLGLDTTAFNLCLDSRKYSSLVDTQTAMTASLGIGGTPAFLINGEPVIGAQPFEVFQQIIEREADGSEE